MKTLRLTIKNYRGFSDSHPCRIDISPGFTALLGPNNAGKSSLKLFFYELRNLFVSLTQLNTSVPSNAYHALFGNGPNVQYQGITDIDELFNNSAASRPISIEFEILNPTSASTSYLSKVVATCERATPNLWTFSTYASANLELNLSRRGYAPKSASLVDISGVGLVACDDFFEAMHVLRDARYYGPFRNAINQGSGDHFDMKIGTSFIDLWSEWKTSGVKAKTLAINQVTDEIRTLFEFDQLEINASTSLKTLIVTINGHSYRLNELGSGLSQFIMVLGNAAVSRPSILLLDEPETNLHPSLQIDFLLSVVNYSRHGCIFSTHSIGLARSVADRIYSFQRRANTTTVRPFEATPNYVEFIGELSFSAFKELGVERVLLVEGVNDVKTVQQLLRLVKKEHSTVILPLGGDQLATGGRADELSELKRLTNEVFALVDSERKNAGGEPSERRKQFAGVCEQLGIDVCVTDRRAIENYFTDTAVKAVYGDTYAALGPYELLKDSSNPWAKSGSWKIARHMLLTDLADTDLGQFLRRI